MADHCLNVFAVAGDAGVAILSLQALWTVQRDGAHCIPYGRGRKVLFIGTRLAVSELSERAACVCPAGGW